MSDEIQITGIRATGHHGVLEFERINGQVFSVDVTLHIDVSSAAESDDLSRTVDYDEIARMVNGHITGEPVQLIETLADRIARECLKHSIVSAADVTVHKPQAPISVPFEDVAVTVRRSR